jgi:Mg-chelatase subunit ChlD
MFAFASKKVYMPQSAEVEKIADDELDEGLEAVVKDEAEEEQDDLFLSEELASNRVQGEGAVQKRGGGFFSSLFGSSSSSSSSSRAPAPTSGHRRKRRARKPSEPSGRVHEYRAANTNVFALNLGTLGSDAHVMTGDPTSCEQCGVFFSAISRIVAPPIEGAAASSAVDDDDVDDVDDGNDDDAQVWECEFCGHSQRVYLDDDERPSESTVDYLIESAPQGSSDSGLIVYVIDTSGSMCSTTEVEGSHQIKGLEKLEAERARLNIDRSQQYLPGQRRDTTWISRLQAAQAAISEQLRTLALEHPDKRVCLIEFSQDVVVHGDGSGAPLTIAGDRLDDYDALMAFGQELSVDKPIKETIDALDKIVWSLEEGGQTALGPAVVVALGLANSAERGGSSIMVCTDGLANIGVLSIDGVDATSDEAHAQAVRESYAKAGLLARAAGTTTNVVSIEGSDCCMEYLGLLADESGGSVDIVPAIELTKNFASIMSTASIAMCVKATLVLHKGLYVCRDADADEATSSSKLVEDVGSVQDGTEVTFRFGVRADFAKSKSSQQGSIKKAEKPIVDAKDDGGGADERKNDDNDVDALPFQVQVVFTRPDGSRYVRVVSLTQQLTTDREEAERDADIAVLGLATTQQAARYAKEGDYEKARLHAFSNARVMKRAAVDERQRKNVSIWARGHAALDGAIAQELETEQADGFTFAPQQQQQQQSMSSSVSSAPSASFKAARRQRRVGTDQTATAIYQQKNAKSKSFGFL